MAEVAKDNLSGNILLGRDYPRSPGNTLPASSRRDSLRPAHPGGGSESPAPLPQAPRLTRKRATSLDTGVANEPRTGDFALASVNTVNTVSGGDKVCLCQPDPKIPRPRNGV